MKRQKHLYTYSWVVLLPFLLLLCLGLLETSAHAADLPRQQTHSVDGSGSIRDSVAPADDGTPVLSVSRHAINFAGEAGGSDPRFQWFGITKIITGSVHWDVSVDGGAPWLDVLPTSGLDDGFVRVSANMNPGTLLLPGTYVETLTVSADETTAVETITVTLTVASTVPPMYSEDFDSYSPGDDPDDWLDTDADNSLEEDDSLFEVLNVGGERAFGTESTLTNIHSHYVGEGNETFSSYEYTGRMRMTSDYSGIGVTFLSQYPRADKYYRLRRHSGDESFQMSSHGTTITGGTMDTGVVPDRNAWYLFRIRVEDVGIQTEIKAKVWAEGSAEPTDWQVECYDASSTRLTSGTIGVWSYSSGSKYWDDLAVNPLPPEPDERPPFAHGHDPAPGETNADPSSNVVVRVGDIGVGVDSTTLAMTVGGAPVALTVTGSSVDYTLTYDPPTDFAPGEVVMVTVDACDLATSANCMDTEVYSFTVRGLPVIDVWYGSYQVFGHIGNPQEWVNILGNVSDPDGVTSLVYSLNGGLASALSIGPDTRRLAAEGDFNVDIAHTDLISGLNQVVITATDSFNNQAVETVTIEYTSGNTWPTSYSIDWSSATAISDVAQIVDGVWALEADSIRSAAPGYDRMVAIGETTWQDYEVMVPITIHDIDTAGYEYPSGGPGVGILMRWTGHTDDPISGWQPKTGYFPLGAVGWYRWQEDALGERLQMLGSENTVITEDTSGRELDDEVSYVFKMHVETVPGQGGLYGLKVWEDGQPEPSEWDLVAQEELSDPQNGSFLLLSHHVDASYGDVTVSPGPFIDTIQPIISNVQVTAGETSATITWSTNEPATSTVAYGTSPAYGSSVTDDTLVTEHTITLTGLSSGLLYHYQIISEDDSGNAARSTDSTFRTAGVPSSIVSDDFNTCDLNTTIWTLVDPYEGDPSGEATLVMTGTHTEDAWVSISIPPTTSHNVWTENLAPRIMQPANDVNFEVEVKFESELSEEYQMQGILIEEEEDSDYLRFDFYSDGSDTYIFATSFVDGTPTVPTEVDNPITNTNVAPLYMRVRRETETWTLFYSYEGENWTTAVSFAHPLTVTAVGAFVGNAGTNPPAHTGSIDYFFNTAFPVEPEDQDRNTLTANVVGNGTVLKDPDLTAYTCYQAVTLTAEADLGWTFDSWSGDLAGDDNPVTVVMTESQVVTATFTQDEYTLTVNVVGNGTVVKEPAQATYHYGDVVTLTATADTGWGFAGWSGDLISPDSVDTITMDGNKVVTAVFTQDEYSLTVNVVGDGTVVREPVKATYQYGDVVTLTATADLHWVFAGWSGDLVSSDNPDSITMDGNKVVTATFTQTEYTLTVNIVGSGTVVKEPAQATYHYGDVVTLTAIADTGWTFAGWSGDLLGSENPDTIMINGNKTVTATFDLLSYTLTIAAVGPGTTDPAPDVYTYTFGTQVMITATADPGAFFLNWSGDLVGSANPETILIDGDKVVTATFTTETVYMLTILKGGTGSGTTEPPLGMHGYISGTTAVLTATADAGSTFDGWSGDVNSLTNSISVTMDSDKTVTATFTLEEYTLTVDIVGDGTVVVEPDQLTYHYGDVVTLTATAALGWSFSSWSGDLVGSANPATLTITGNQVVTATFRQDRQVFLPLVTRNLNALSAATSTYLVSSDATQPAVNAASSRPRREE